MADSLAISSPASELVPAVLAQEPETNGSAAVPEPLATNGVSEEPASGKATVVGNGSADAHVAASEWKPPDGVTTAARDSKGKYVPDRALELISEVAPILHLFLSGKMKEADDAVKQGDPKAETLYYSLGEFVVPFSITRAISSWLLSVGQTLIEAFKAFMSFEDQVRFRSLHPMRISLNNHSLLYTLRVRPLPPAQLLRPNTCCHSNIHNNYSRTTSHPL